MPVFFVPKQVVFLWNMIVSDKEVKAMCDDLGSFFQSSLQRYLVCEMRREPGCLIWQEILQWTQVFRDISSMSVLEQRAEESRKEMTAAGLISGKNQVSAYYRKKKGDFL